MENNIYSTGRLFLMKEIVSTVDKKSTDCKLSKKRERCTLGKIHAVQQKITLRITTQV